MEEGRKFDSGKARFDLVQWDFINEVAVVLTLGANKYGPDNWKLVEQERYVAALFRHLIAHLGGEERDSESGCTHLAHACCNLMFLFGKRKETQ